MYQLMVIGQNGVIGQNELVLIAMSLVTCLVY